MDYSMPSILESSACVTPNKNLDDLKVKLVAVWDLIPVVMTFCVVSRRFQRHYVQRFSATRSLFLFPPWNKFRSMMVYFSTNQYFDYVVMLTILINCIFLAMTKPIDEAEYIFLAIYSLEMVIKVVAKGFILNNYTYLRNPWNWLDFTVIFSGYLTSFIEMGNLAGLRTFRVFRALKTVSIMPSLKTIINALLHSVKQLAEVMTLTIFCLMVFALFALQVYMGQLRNKCVKEYVPGLANTSNYTEWILNENNWYFRDGSPEVCGNASGARPCPTGYSCLQHIGDNPNFGYTSFDNLLWSMLTTFQLITLDYWENVYNMIVATGGPMHVIFFTIVVFFGSFYLINLMLAVVAMSYEEEAEAVNLEKQREADEAAAQKARLGICSHKLDNEKKSDEPCMQCHKILEMEFSPEDNVDEFIHPLNTSANSNGNSNNNNGTTSRKKKKKKGCSAGSGHKGLSSSNAQVSIYKSSSSINNKTSTEDIHHRLSTESLHSKATFVRIKTKQGSSEIKELSENEIQRPSTSHNPAIIKGTSQDSKSNLTVPMTHQESGESNFLEDHFSGVVGDQDFDNRSDDKHRLQVAIPGNQITEDILNRKSGAGNKRPSKIDIPFIVSIQDDNHDRNCVRCKECCLNYGLWLKFQNALFILVHDMLFDTCVTICIIANTAFLAAEHHGMSNDLKHVLNIGNKVFTSFFTLEAILKLIALSKEYFESGWNIFDLIIVFASLLDLSVESVNGISVLRGMRLMRVLKLAQSWTTMKVLLSIIISTLGALGNLTFLLIIVIYIFAVLGMQLFGKTYTPENFYPDEVPRWNFTDFFHSFMMIFRILCGEWIEPLWDCMRAEAKVGVAESCLAIFLPALVMGNFMVLNLFLALLLNSFNSEELKSRKEEVKGESGSFVQGKLNKIKSKLSHKKKKTKEAIKANLLDGRNNGSLQSINKVNGPVFHSEPDLREDSFELVDVSLKNYSKHSSQELVSEEILDIEEEGNEEGHLKTLTFEEGLNDETSEHKQKKPDPCFPYLCTRLLPCYTCFEESWIGMKWYLIRQVIHDIVDNPFFEWTILLLIFASSLSLCFEDINLQDNDDLMFILRIVNMVFAILFTIEMLLKWIAFGLWKYFTSMWTCLDFIIVLVSILSLAIDGSANLTSLRSLRTLRALRPLRAISRWQGMKIVVNALMYAIPSIFNVLLVCLVFWLIFSIMGVQIFGGKFYKCLDEQGERLNISVVNDRWDCISQNYSWVNSKITFDHVGHAYLALFQVATFEGWMEVMADAVDIREVDQQPSWEASIYNYFYFVIFIVCGSFFTLNLFIGVIIDNFNALKKKYEGGVLEMFLTESQKNYYTAMKKLGRKKPQKVIKRPSNELHALFYDISLSRRFEIAIFILIFLNMVSMGIEHYGQSRIVTFTLEICNALFTTIFSLEAIVKIIGLRFQYFTAGWNLFDFILVIASVVGIVMEDLMTDFPVSPTLLRVVRVFRIGRILRLIKAAKGIRKLLFALMVSLPALFNIGALLALITFIYAIIGMTLFGHVKHQGALNDQVNFETFGRSMQVLFRLVTSAGWNDVLEPLLVSPPDCDPNYKSLPNGNCGHPLIAIVYFVSFIIINFMIVINMYIAIILENFNQAHQEEEIGIVEEDLEMFYTKWSKYDPHATQFINFAQISDFIASLDSPLGISKPNTLALVSFNLPIAKGDKIHCLDVLHSLTKYTLGFVDDGSDDFKKLTSQMDEKFKKQFPTRKELEIVSSTREWKNQDNASRILQRFFKYYVRDGHSFGERIDTQTQTVSSSKCVKRSDTKRSLGDMPDMPSSSGGGATPKKSNFYIDEQSDNLEWRTHSLPSLGAGPVSCSELDSSGDDPPISKRENKPYRKILRKQDKKDICISDEEDMEEEGAIDDENEVFPIREENIMEHHHQVEFHQPQIYPSNWGHRPPPPTSPHYRLDESSEDYYHRFPMEHPPRPRIPPYHYPPTSPPIILQGDIRSSQRVHVSSSIRGCSRNESEKLPYIVNSNPPPCTTLAHELETNPTMQPINMNCIRRVIPSVPPSCSSQHSTILKRYSNPIHTYDEPGCSYEEFVRGSSPPYTKFKTPSVMYPTHPPRGGSSSTTKSSQNKQPQQELKYVITESEYKKKAEEHDTRIKRSRDDPTSTLKKISPKQSIKKSIFTPSKKSSSRRTEPTRQTIRRQARTNTMPKDTHEKSAESTSDAFDDEGLFHFDDKELKFIEDKTNCPKK
nr:sodium channel protein 60E-like [Lepeophtheirus salmonis]